MAALIAFIVGFVFSFLGSIPPGTMNLIVFQLGLNNQMNTAMRFTLAVALVEYPYAWLSVKFADLITSSPMLIANMKLITAIVMIVLGIVNLLPSKQQSSRWVQQFNNSGFRRGVFLSILNPMAIPFWVGATAFLTGQDYISLATPIQLHSYLVGISVGSIVLLFLLAHLARKIVTRFGDMNKLKKIPGYLLLLLGVYAMGDYLITTLQK
jgi:threonine/homoserine/homoserine lactone efflux protein